MANRQVATRDFSWYGQGRIPEDNLPNSTTDIEMFRKKESGRINRGTSEIDSRKRFTLPIEPTESLDKNRDYPPIVTVDGSVDTDIDHLMEHPEEEAYADTPAQDIPSRFPKPHIVRVIDGSLDDDIDNLMNHDGTMTHILVDSPKNLNRTDLKEINSKKSSSPKRDSIQDQADRSFNKITRDDLEDEHSGSELVPYFERNNSSKQMMGSTDADFCHLKESVEEGYCSPIAETEMDMDKGDINNDDEKYGKQKQEEIGDGATKEKKDSTAPVSPAVSLSVEVEAGTVKDKVIQLEAINSVDEKSNVKMSNKEGDTEDNKEKQSEQCNEILQNTEASNGAKNEDAGELLERLLKMMPKKELEKRLGITFLDSSSEKKDTESNINISKADSQPSRSASIFNDSFCETPVQDAILMLRNTLENMSSDPNSPNKLESQKTLMTALKVAGDSMNAAAKMADALSLLVKSNQTKPALKESPSPEMKVKASDSKTQIDQEVENDDTVQSKTRSKTTSEGRKKKLQERQSKARVPENFKFIGNNHDHRDAESDCSNDEFLRMVVDDRKEKLNADGMIESRFNRDRKHKSKAESGHKIRRGEEDESMNQHRSSRREETGDADEERIKERIKDKSAKASHNKEESDKKASHRRNKTSKEKRRKSRNAMEEFDESPEVKQRHKQDGKERRHERIAVEDDYHAKRNYCSSKLDDTTEDIPPWTLPDNDSLQRKGYFDQVVRRLQPFSPPRHYEPPSQEKQIIRAKLVGSCVDPSVRDSDFDSIEFNGNARMSESTLVHYGDEQESD